jgi:diguanylate cyclase (GGDEF)-like protein
LYCYTGKSLPRFVRWMLLTLMLVLVTWVAPAWSQQIPLRYYTQLDGLSNLSVTAMASDADGYMWVGTENGLFRCNGAEFRRYAQEQGLPDPFIAALYVDEQRRLWVGNNEGLFLKQGERFEPILHNGKKLPIAPGQKFYSSPDGSLYFISRQHLYALNMASGQPQLQVILPNQQNPAQATPDTLSGLYREKNGDFWLGCGSSICQYSGNQIHVWDAAQGVPGDQWLSFHRDNSGQLWARGEQHIVVLQASEKHFTDRTPPGDILHKKGLVTWISADAEGRILSNADQSLIRWNKDHWENFDRKNGLKIAGGLTALLYDKDGGMWLGSRGLGLIKWLGSGNWESWTMAQGMPDDVALSMVRDKDGVLHIGTRSGPAQLRPGERQFSSMNNGLEKLDHQWSGMVVDNSGVVWGSTYSGQLMRFDAKARVYQQMASLPQIFRMLPDRQGNIWLATIEGLFVFDASASKINVVHPAGLDGLQIPKGVNFRDLCLSPNGNIWFMARDHLLRFDGKSWATFEVRYNGQSPYMSAISCTAENDLWLGTRHAGLLRASASASISNGVLQLRQQESPVLKNKIIFSLLEDSRGWLWAGTDAGIAVWNKKQWRLFNQSNGFVWNETNGHSFYEDNDAAMWVATSNGISHILKPENMFKEHQLNTLIESIHRDGNSYASDKPLALAWSPQPLELVLASLNFRNRSALEFHYRLSGLEENWSSSTTPKVRYTALEPGSYRFEYFVSNADAQQTSAVKSLDLIIQPPWWRTIWFYMLLATALLMLVFALHRYRLRKLTELQARTEAIVRERTRELEISREELKVRALRDGLTSAWNRSAMLEMLDMELGKAQRQQTPLLLALLDLDHFKRINDTYGHPAGDAVLVEVVRRLNATVRQSDAVGRYGGEEFLIIIPGLDVAHGKSLIERLLKSVREQEITISEHQSIAVTSSFGVIAFDPQNPMTAAELISHADQALYRSKQQGRNRVEYVE